MKHLQPPVLQYQTRNKSPRSIHGQQFKNITSSRSETDKIRQKTRALGNIVQVRGVPMNQRQKTTNFERLKINNPYSKKQNSYKDSGKVTQNLMTDSQPSYFSKGTNKKETSKNYLTYEMNEDQMSSSMMVSSLSPYMDYGSSKRQDPIQNKNRRQNYKQKYDHSNTNNNNRDKQKLQTQDDFGKFIPKHIRNKSKRANNLHDTNTNHNNSHYDHYNIVVSSNNDQETHYDRRKQDKEKLGKFAYQEQYYNKQQNKEQKYHTDLNKNLNSNTQALNHNFSSNYLSHHDHDYIDSKHHKFSCQHDHTHLQQNLKKTYQSDTNTNHTYQYDSYKNKFDRYDKLEKQRQKQKQKSKLPPKVPSFLDNQLFFKTDRASNKDYQKKFQKNQKQDKSDRGQKKIQKIDKDKKQSTGSYFSSRGQQKYSKLTSSNHKKRKHSNNHIENFHIIKKLGKGSYGNVFLVRQIETTALFAMKIMSKAKIRDCQNQQNIFRQLKIHLYLDHRYLVQLYGMFDDAEYIYLIMEYQNQGSLFDILKQKITYSQKKTAKVAKQLIDALSYMHEQKIIHRDLKLQNIMSCNGVLKIGDFGCAVHTFDLRQTKIGSLAYHSPQQLMEGQYDQKVDIWSLGIIVYQLLYGQTPFDEDIIKIVRHEPDAKLSDLKFPQNIPISSEAKDFIIKLLQKKPDKRMSIRQANNHPFITKNAKQEDSFAIFV